jgi:hypothetical protein
MTTRTGEARTDLLRLTEAGAEAAVILALVVVPTAWRMVDAQLAVVLAGMHVGLTVAVYALHAVTFDYFRLTGPGVSPPAGEPEGPRRPYPTMTTASASRRHRPGRSPARAGGPHRRPTPGVTDVQTGPVARR